MKTKCIMLAILATAMLSCSDDDKKGTNLSPAYEVAQNDPLTIPDAAAGNFPVPVETSLEVMATGAISAPEKFKVVLELDHPWCGDVIVQLIAPGGDTITLIKRLGASAVATFGSSANYVAGNFLTINSLTGAEIMVTSLGTDDVIPTGTYLTTGSDASNPTTVTMSDLGAFLSGRSVNGVWKLRLSDNGTSDFGSLKSWKIVLDEGALN